MSTVRMETPLGPLALEASSEGLTRARFVDARDRDARDRDAEPLEHAARGPQGRLLASARAQMLAYFSGELTEFELPLAPVGTTFQRRVWQALARVPFGETTTYRELATAVRPPSAARAVGRANALNPLVILIPCHRVIGATGALTGYGGGIERKRRLLELEQRRRGQAKVRSRRTRS